MLLSPESKYIDGEWVTIEDLYHKHKPFMHKVSYRFLESARRKYMDLDDLVSACAEALVRAFYSFDASNGVKFITYYGRAAYQQIYREMNNNNRVTINEAAAALLKKIVKSNDTYLTPQEIAEKYTCGIEMAKGVIQYYRLQLISLDKKTNDNSTELHIIEGFEEDLTAVNVQHFLSTLNDRQKRIANLLMDGKQFKEIAVEFGVSSERIRQIAGQIKKRWSIYNGNG